jgi:glycosyltransferase involved in cell wall biosynthesis
MTIGIDCRLYSPKFTGIGRYVFELAKNLIELDQENHYILYFNQPEFDQFQVPNERWQKKLVNISHYSLDEQLRWYWFLKKEPIDLMHFTHFNAPVLYKKPCVVTIHDLTLHYYPYKEYSPKWSLKKQLQIWIYRFIMGRVVKNAKHVIAVSENTKKDLIKEYSLATEKITTVYEGATFVIPTAAEESLTQKKFSITKPYLIYTGVWRSHKNLLNLIQAFKTILDSGNDIQLVITGKTDPTYPEIPALIEQLKLQDRVILTGFVDDADLGALMSGALAYVFPSLYEGFGLPPLEAMALGVPVASSNTSSLPEVCGDAALYFDPKNVQDMAEKLNQLIKHPEVRQDLILKGFKNVQRFSWKKMASEILELYKKTS